MRDFLREWGDGKSYDTISSCKDKVSIRKFDYTPYSKRPIRARG